MPSFSDYLATVDVTEGYPDSFMGDINSAYDADVAELAMQVQALSTEVEMLKALNVQLQEMNTLIITSIGSGSADDDSLDSTDEVNDDSVSDEDAEINLEDLLED